MNKNPWKLTTLVLTGILGAHVAYCSVGTASADAQPKMHQAIDALKAAEGFLAGASDDKGGHRVKALAATRNAIEETRKGIEFDSKHDSDKKDAR